MGFFNNKSQTTAEVANSVHQPAKTVTLRKLNGPAVSLDKVKATGSVSLEKSFTKSQFALSKFGMDGARANVIMLLDYSGSMSGDYARGTVQKIVERALGFAANIDDDGQMPIIPFSHVLHNTVTADLSNFSGIVQSQIMRNTMGGTVMEPAFEQVRKFAKKSNDPVYCIVVGDGSPSDKAATKRKVIELANYPVFIKFLSVRPVDFLDELDDLSDNDRLLDNVDAKSIENPDNLTPMQFAEIMADEWASWVQLATAKGVLNAA